MFSCFFLICGYLTGLLGFIQADPIRSIEFFWFLIKKKDNSKRTPNRESFVRTVYQMFVCFQCRTQLLNESLLVWLQQLLLMQLPKDGLTSPLFWFESSSKVYSSVSFNISIPKQTVNLSLYWYSAIGISFAVVMRWFLFMTSWWSSFLNAV